MITINKGTIVVALIGYGLYHFFSTGNVTIIPPSKNDVKNAVEQVNPELLTRGGLNVPTSCHRVGGTLFKEGVFSCPVEFSSNIEGTDGLDKVTIVKKNGKWIWRR